LQKYDLIATCEMGLESVLKDEIKKFGYKVKDVQNGKLFFSGNFYDIAFCNINLRTAGKIYLVLDNFYLDDFDDLYDNIFNKKWDEYIKYDSKINVYARTSKSKIKSKRSIQSITKKAIIDRLSKEYNINQFEETGDDFSIRIDVYKNNARILVNSSGKGLHRRGYRKETGVAPLRETLAAGLILLSGWNKNFYFVDPFCGSGTLIIEAALIGMNIPPGINRDFAFLNWKKYPVYLYDKAKNISQKAIEKNIDLNILGTDINYGLIQRAEENLKEAGVEGKVNLKQMALKDFSFPDEKGFIVTNPPYGERIENSERIDYLYQLMGEKFSGEPGWSINILTAVENFRDLFGRKEDKNRKLYNGNIKTYFYQYYYAKKRKRHK